MTAKLAKTKTARTQAKAGPYDDTTFKPAVKRRLNAIHQANRSAHDADTAYLLRLTKDMQATIDALTGSMDGRPMA